MKNQQFYTDAAGQQLILNFLTDTFGYSKEEPNYSLGFQRLQKLNKKQSMAFFKAIYLKGFKGGSENHLEQKRILAEMTEAEFLKFKKSLK